MTYDCHLCWWIWRRKRTVLLSDRPPTTDSWRRWSRRRNQAACRCHCCRRWHCWLDESRTHRCIGRFDKQDDWEPHSRPGDHLDTEHHNRRWRSISRTGNVSPPDFTAREMSDGRTKSERKEEMTGRGKRDGKRRREGKGVSVDFSFTTLISSVITAG